MDLKVALAGVMVGVVIGNDKVRGKVTGCIRYVADFLASEEGVATLKKFMNDMEQIRKRYGIGRS